MKGTKMSQTIKRILNLKARPEQQVVLKKVVLLYAVPGNSELHHQWIEIGDQKILPEIPYHLDFSFDSFTAHNG
jgi:myosin-crossreactive antigen